jgi:guanylate kinase
MRFDLERRPFLLVLSAPSGGGKSAVLARLLETDPSITYSVSYTTRERRGHEVDGEDYHFVTLKRFNEMIEAQAFYEFAKVHGHMYGTSAEAIDRALCGGKDVAMDIDVQGGLNIHRKRPQDSVLIFLMPPSMSVLESRLRGRASDNEEAILLRLRNAEREMEHWKSYDYMIVNEDLDATVLEVRKIVDAERARAGRLHIKRLG